MEAAAKVVGGQYYTYAMRGDGQVPLRRVPADRQTAALDALLETLEPGALTLPEGLISLIPPRPYGYPAHRELFDRYTGVTFDPLSPAGVAAEMTVGMLLHPERAARLVEQAALDPGMPGLADVLDRLETATFGAEAGSGYEAEVKRLVEDVVVRELMGLAGSAPMPQVRAMAELRLRDLRERMRARGDGGAEASRAHALRLTGEIDRFLARPLAPWERPRPVSPPPGSPIGGGR